MKTKTQENKKARKSKRVYPKIASAQGKSCFPKPKFLSKAVVK